MVVRNVNDSPMERLREVVENRGRENPFESSSIRNGMVRFIGGVLKLEAGALLKGIGTFDWTGPGSIAGNFEVLDGGVIKVGGVLISPVGGGRIMIGQGPVAIILDGGTGSLTMGDVRIEAGKIYVKDMVLDPAVAGGALTFPNGSRLEADDENNGERLVAGNAVVNVGAVTSIRKGPSSVIVSSDEVTVNAAGGGDINLLGAVSIPAIPFVSGTGLPLNTLMVTANGQLRRSDGS